MHPRLIGWGSGSRRRRPAGSLDSSPGRQRPGRHRWSPRRAAPGNANCKHGALPQKMSAYIHDCTSPPGQEHHNDGHAQFVALFHTQMLCVHVEILLRCRPLLGLTNFAALDSQKCELPLHMHTCRPEDSSRWYVVRIHQFMSRAHTMALRKKHALFVIHTVYNIFLIKNTTKQT